MRGELQVLFHGTARVKRNLEAGEIVGQIAAVLRDQGVEPPRSGSISYSWAWANLFEL